MVSVKTFGTIVEGAYAVGVGAAIGKAVLAAVAGNPITAVAFAILGIGSLAGVYAASWATSRSRTIPAFLTHFQQRLCTEQTSCAVAHGLGVGVLGGLACYLVI